MSWKDHPYWKRALILNFGLAFISLIFIFFAGGSYDAIASIPHIITPLFAALFAVLVTFLGKTKKQKIIYLILGSIASFFIVFIGLGLYVFQEALNIAKYEEFEAIIDLFLMFISFFINLFSISLSKIEYKSLKNK